MRFCVVMLHKQEKGVPLQAGLGVFSECVAALGTAQELRRRFIGPTGLYQPDVGSVVAASGALYLYGWHRVELLFLSADYCNHLLRVVLDEFSIEDSWFGFFF